GDDPAERRGADVAAHAPHPLRDRRGAPVLRRDAVVHRLGDQAADQALRGAGMSAVATEIPVVELSAPWRLRDRAGLAFAWFLGLLFCAITAAIVVYLLVQGLKYVRPSLFVTQPAAGFTESETGGFLDPLIGTFAVGLMAMAIAFPVGLGIG